jgi:hypothetical protein
MMAPKQMNQQNDPMYPTSPWTECYQAAQNGGESESSDRRAANSSADEFQKPTQDALSEIYNRGY